MVQKWLRFQDRILRAFGVSQITLLQKQFRSYAASVMAAQFHKPLRNCL